MLRWCAMHEVGVLEMEMTLDRYLLIINIAGFILFGINTLLYTFTENGQIDRKIISIQAPSPEGVF